MYIPKCFHEQVRKEYLIKRLKEMYNKDNKETQAEQLPQVAVIKSVCVHVMGSIIISENVIYAECRNCGELY